MPETLQPAPFIEESDRIPVIDVRSPSEFGQGHVPRAVNIPLFDDAERAVVGTLYKHSGREAAVRRGLSIATPKIPHYLALLKKTTSGKRILVHCWRGGMRSEHMAALFESNGYDAGVLEGGYKAYRRFVRASLAVPARIIVVGGYTGSGKTDLLKGIAALGCQVIDLEGLASHKGSAFGALGLPPQPTNEQFENNLYDLWRRFDRTKPVWIEDESRMIGRVTLPDPVVAMIGTGTLIRVNVPKELRVQRLVSEYAGYDKALLGEAVARISERLGGARAAEALRAIEEGSFERVADNVLTYYDKAYNFAIERRPLQEKITVDLPGGITPETPALLAGIIDKKEHYGTGLP